jgi:diguanylate cyclase (GGDEF)-like protein
MPVATLLIIDDDNADRKAVAHALRALGADCKIQEARDGRQGLELAVAGSFDCILIDYHLPDMSGLDLLGQLHDRLGIAAPIVMLTGEGNEAVAVEAMKRGAHDYLPKSQLGPDSLSRAVTNAIEKSSLQKKLAEAQKQLEQLALYDPLTGLGNRNLFNRELTRAILMSKRKGTSFALLMMDLDKFKAANDTFGHEAGDAILATIGSRMRDITRAADACFRLGGDEFTAILDADSDGKAVVQRIQAAFAEPVLFGAHVLSVGVSIGMAIYPVDGANATDLLRAADAGMYDVKKSKVKKAATIAGQKS